MRYHSVPKIHLWIIMHVELADNRHQPIYDGLCYMEPSKYFKGINNSFSLLSTVHFKKHRSGNI